MERTSINSFGLPNIVIPAEVLFNKNLTANEKILFGIINNLAANEHGYCWASNRYLSKFIGVRPDTISSVIGKLSKQGYLRLKYSTRPDGVQVRKIFIDKGYTYAYEDMLKETHKELNSIQETKKPGRKSSLSKSGNTPEKIQNPLGHSPKPVLVKLKTGIGKTQNNIDIDIDKKLDNKNIGYLKKSKGKDKNLDSWKKTLDLLPEDWKHDYGLQKRLYEYEQHRKEIKKPLTDLARKKLAKKFIKHGIDKTKRSILQSIENGWTGVFPESLDNKPRKGRNAQGISNEHNYAAQEMSAVTMQKPKPWGAPINLRKE